MIRTVVRLALLSALALAGCEDGGADHAPLPGEPTDRTEQPQSPAAPEDEEPDASASPTAPPAVPALHPSVDGYPEALVTLSGDDLDLEIAVKVADDTDRRAHGLMEVEALPAGTGMLFVFQEERDGGFWMKNTLVPLDIAYVGADDVIHTILAMEPCQADPCDVYEPDAPYLVALEVPQGWFAEVGVGVSDTLDWEPLDDG